MEEPQHVLMDCTSKIIRNSIHTLLKHFHYFTTIPIPLLIPFSASILLSQTLFKYHYSPLPETIHGFHHAQFGSIFEYLSGFPLSYHQIIKSQTFVLELFPFAFSLPFALSSFIIAKASIIQALNHHEPSFQPPFLSFISVLKPLILTHLCSLAMLIAINSATFSILFIAMNYLQSFWLPYFSLILPVFGAVFYSLFANNTVLVSNLALVMAGMGTCKGLEAIYRSFLLRKGKNSMAVLLFLPINLGLSAIEALFRFRVIRIYRVSGKITASMALEGLLIAYLYSLLIVLDTIICCMFYKSCESNPMATNHHHQIHGSYCFDLEIVQEESELSFDDE